MKTHLALASCLLAASLASAATGAVAAETWPERPVKVIVGAHDQSLTADFMTATYLAWYPNAELEVMANAGHYPMSEAPVALVTSIEAFLRKDAKKA